jgi:hypothetical protein
MSRHVTSCHRPPDLPHATDHTQTYEPARRRAIDYRFTSFTFIYSLGVRWKVHLRHVVRIPNRQGILFLSGIRNGIRINVAGGAEWRPGCEAAVTRPLMCLPGLFLAGWPTSLAADAVGSATRCGPRHRLRSGAESAAADRSYRRRREPPTCHSRAGPTHSRGQAGAVAHPMPPDQRKPATVPPGRRQAGGYCLPGWEEN